MTSAIEAASWTAILVACAYLVRCAYRGVRGLFQDVTKEKRNGNSD